MLTILAIIAVLLLAYIAFSAMNIYWQLVKTHQCIADLLNNTALSADRLTHLDSLREIRDSLARVDRRLERRWDPPR